MRGGIWKHRKTDLSIWINQVQKFSRMASQGDQNRGTEGGFQRALQESDQLAEIMEQEGIEPISIPDIQKGLHEITGGVGIGSWADQAEEDTTGGEDLDRLISQTTPVLKQEDKFVTPPQHISANREIIEEEGQHEEEDAYEESFASQRETAQLREEFETMSGEIASLKSTINALLKEREALPGHLTSIREDINRQMTTMLDKLHSALESDLLSQNVQAATTAITEIQSASVDKLKAAADYASDRPREGSPIATKGAKLEGKRRFRPVK